MNHLYVIFVYLGGIRHGKFITSPLMKSEEKTEEKHTKNVSKDWVYYKERSYTLENDVKVQASAQKYQQICKNSSL